MILAAGRRMRLCGLWPLVRRAWRGELGIVVGVVVLVRGLGGVIEGVRVCGSG